MQNENIYNYFVVYFSLTLQVNSQIKNVSGKSKIQFNKVKLLEDKPSVYVTFENYGKFTPATAKKTYDIAWFRLHNNFKGAISFCSYDSSVSPTGKIGVHYEIEKTPNRTDLSSRNNDSVPIGFPPYDFCNSYNLKSGKTFLFGIPQNHLLKDTRVKIQFYFPWEDELDFLTVKEPQHYIYYYVTNLPTKIAD